MGALDGRVALVTGAELTAGGDNIGSATAKALARAGASVFVTSRDKSNSAALAAAIRAAGGAAASCASDLLQEVEVERVVLLTATQFGGLDILVNNVGGVESADHGVCDISADVWDRAFALNSRTAFLGCKHAIPLMLARRRGAIVNVGSAQGLTGDVSHPAYGAAKAAVGALTAYVAAEFGTRGIRCNSVAPGLTLTANANALVPDLVKQIHLRHSLVDRLATPNDVAAVIAFLVSDGAAMINGETTLVDGGMNSHRALVRDMRDWESTRSGEMDTR